ncbi:MAG: PIN domain-containing protein [Gammaproteobacteria bacterium]|nr:PIN domain-containing protein [Gammaproteobacteria bacterium]
MIAVDTNALVRLAVNDSQPERDAVVALLQANRVLLLTTVLLETEWVLRSRYGYQRQQVADYFDWLAGLESCTLEADAIARTAFELHRKGLDFANALHLVSARSVPLHTLDQAFAKRAAKLGTKVQLIAVTDSGEAPDSKTADSHSQPK